MYYMQHHNMAYFKATVQILIVSCIAINLVQTSALDTSSSTSSSHSSLATPGKYHHHRHPHNVAIQKSQKKPVSPKGLNMMAVISTRQNPIKNWLGAFNRNHSGPPLAGGGLSNGPVNVAQDAVPQTCRCR